jgi:hypothetical protein
MATTTRNAGTVSREAVVAACKTLGLDADKIRALSMDASQVVVLERGTVVPPDSVASRSVEGSGLLEWTRVFAIEDGEVDQ